MLLLMYRMASAKAKARTRQGSTSLAAASTLSTLTPPLHFDRLYASVINLRLSVHTACDKLIVGPIDWLVGVEFNAPLDTDGL